MSSRTDGVSNDVTSQMLIAAAGGRDDLRSANLSLRDGFQKIHICSAENHFPLLTAFVPLSVERI